MDVLLDEHKKILLLLLKHNVDFILIGGYAVIFYGYERTTSDMDIWLKPDNSNKQKLINALRERGILEEDINALSMFDFTTAKAFHIGKAPKKIDFLTKVQGVSYDEANNKKIFFPLKGKQIPIVQYHHLITMKMLTNRLQDKADIEKLQKLQRLKDK